MNTLTLSRFAKAITGDNQKPVPSVVQMHQDAVKTSPVTPFIVETKAQSVTIPFTETTTELEMGKKEDLKAKQEKLRAELLAADKELEELRNSERADVLKATQAAMAEYGFTAYELLGRSSVQRRAGKGIPRGPAPVKFKDAGTGSTWSGRGQKPTWLVTALAGGKKLEDFAV